MIRHQKGQMNSSIPILNAVMADYYLNNGLNEEARQLFERLVSRIVHFILILLCPPNLSYADYYHIELKGEISRKSESSFRCFKRVSH